MAEAGVEVLSENMSELTVTVCDDTGKAQFDPEEMRKYQWKYSQVGAGEIKKKIMKKTEELAKLKKKKKPDEKKIQHLELVIEMEKEAIGKRVRMEGQLAKRSGVDGGKSPKLRTFLLVVTPPYDEKEGPQYDQVPIVTLEYYDGSKFGAPKGVLEIDKDCTCEKGDGSTIQTSTGERFTMSAQTGMKMTAIDDMHESLMKGKPRPYFFNSPNEEERDAWVAAVKGVIEESGKMYTAAGKIQALTRGKMDRKKFQENLAAKKSQVVGYAGEAAAGAAAAGAALYAVGAPKAQKQYVKMKEAAAAAHADLEEAVAAKYAKEVYMEIDFAAPRPNTTGLAYGQLVQWWAVTGGVNVSDEDIAAGKAIWEEVDTDGADEGDGLLLDGFTTVFTKLQAEGLLDTAWAALEAKATAVGTSWGDRTAASVNAGAAATYASGAKVKQQTGGYLKKAKAAAAGTAAGTAGMALYAKAAPKAASAYAEISAKAAELHEDIDESVAAKYAAEVFQEIDFSEPREAQNGLFYNQLVTWWAETGGVYPGDEEVEKGKAIWEEYDIDGADAGAGLLVEDFTTVFYKMQQEGLLDTTWGALKNKAKTVGSTWGERASTSLATGPAARFRPK
eukprot:COSAG05_NODE_1797_length_4070_cov_83.199698_2_plen_617_part_00